MFSASFGKLFIFTLPAAESFFSTARIGLTWAPGQSTWRPARRWEVPLVTQPSCVHGGSKEKGHSIT